MATQSNTSESKSNKFILVAEDDMFYANVYKVKLAHEGYEVQVVGNGDWVMRSIAEKIPDLILLDLVMPVKDGFETLREIRADDRYKNIPVVVLSNLGQEEDIERAKQTGATDYLIKTNISIQQLLETINKYVT